MPTGLIRSVVVVLLLDTGTGIHMHTLLFTQKQIFQVVYQLQDLVLRLAYHVREDCTQLVLQQHQQRCMERYFQMVVRQFLSEDFTIIPLLPFLIREHLV